MGQTLDDAFRTYADTAVSGPRGNGEVNGGRKSPRLLVHESLVLRDLVHRLEDRPQFRRLVGLTADSELWRAHHGKSSFNCETTVRNFFRRSGFYLDAFDDKPVDVTALFEKYREALESRNVTVRYLAPLDLVRFDEDSMDFGAFEVRRFSLEELEGILQSRLREAFWPGSVVDVNRLQHYWCLCVEERVEAPARGKVRADLGALPRPVIEYSGHAKSVEQALQLLALFDWQLDWSESEWAGFQVPFVLRLNDSLIDSPSRTPDTSKLSSMQPVWDSSGQAIGDEPTTWFSLEGQKTLLFKRFVREMVSLVGSLQTHQHGWRFFEVAMGFFLKAFFSQRLEQLLWHIITLEALLGEAGPRATKRLSRRVAAILEHDGKKREDVKRLFGVLYNFRSRLVHGDPWERTACSRDMPMAEARHLARRVLIWFVHFLTGIQNCTGEARAPKREELLKLVDQPGEALPRLARVASALPAGFPYVQAWLA